ncbi:MAG: hypothetical protein ABII90_12485, partial [Bacteroidota bacterium]
MIIFFSLLDIGIGNLYDHKIVHEFPYGFFASDSFWWYVYSEHTYDVGNFKYRPFYDSFGHEDVVGTVPPVLFHLSAMFAHTSGFELHNTHLLLIVTMFCLSPLVFYFLVRKYNKNIAVLALAITPLIFAKTSYYSVLWGKHIVITGGFFLVCFVWSLKEMDLKQFFIIIAIFLSATFISHPPEAIFGAGMILLFIAYNYAVKRKIEIDTYKKIVFALLIVAVLSSYYFVDFINTFGVWQGELGVDFSNAGVK